MRLKQTKKIRRKRTVIKLPFNLLQLLLDYRLTITTLAAKSELSLSTVNRINSESLITIAALNILKNEFNSDLEKYISKSES